MNAKRFKEITNWLADGCPGSPPIDKTIVEIGEAFRRYPEMLEIIREMDNAVQHYGPMNSAHEGYAVILEEMDELWSEIKKRDPDPDLVRLEARQVAAMGLRFLVDICRPNGGE